MPTKFDPFNTAPYFIILYSLNIESLILSGTWLASKACLPLIYLPQNSLYDDITRIKIINFISKMEN